MEKTSTEPVKKHSPVDRPEGQEQFTHSQLSDDSTSIILPTKEDEVGRRDEFSDSSSEDSLTLIDESLALIDPASQRDYLRDQLEFIIEHLETNMPLHPSGPDLPLPWAEEDPLTVMRDHVVAAIEKLFELGTAEGISEAQKGLVLQAKSLCEEQCCQTSGLVYCCFRIRKTLTDRRLRIAVKDSFFFKLTFRNTYSNLATLFRTLMSPRSLFTRYIWKTFVASSPSCKAP